MQKTLFKQKNQIKTKMIKFIRVIISLIFFAKLGNSDTPIDYTFGLEEPDLPASSETVKLFETLHQGKNYRLGTPIFTELNSDVIFVDEKKWFELDLERHNGEISGGISEILFTKKQTGNEKTLYNYKFNYGSRSNIIYPFEQDRNLNRFKGTSESFINIKYNTKDIGLDTVYFNNIILKSMGKVDSISFLTFFLNTTNNNLYTIYKLKNTFRISNVFTKESIDDFFIVNQVNIQKNILCTINYKSNTLVLYLIEITSTNNKSFNILPFGEPIPIKLGEKIKKVGFLEPSYILILYENGNNIIVKSSTEEYSLLSKGSENVKLYDFIIFRKTIYVHVASVGIDVFELTIDPKPKATFIQRLSIPNINEMKFSVNPFLSYLYLNVIINKDISNDYFIELFLNDEYSPIVNKVFTSSPDIKQYYTDIIQIDNFFSYVYNTRENKLFIIRQSMINSIPFVTYYFNITINDEVIKVFRINDYDSEQSCFAILDSNHHLTIISNFREPDHEAKLYFPESGDFSITFIQRSEICSKTLSIQEDKVLTCQKIIRYDFKVYKNDGLDLLSGFISCLIIIAGFILVFGLVLVARTDCCKKRKNLHVLLDEKEQNRKENFYEGESLETNHDEDREPVIKFVETQNPRHHYIKSEISSNVDTQSSKSKEDGVLLFRHSKAQSSEIPLEK